MSFTLVTPPPSPTRGPKAFVMYPSFMRSLLSLLFICANFLPSSYFTFLVLSIPWPVLSHFWIISQILQRPPVCSAPRNGPSLSPFFFLPRAFWRIFVIFAQIFYLAFSHKKGQKRRFPLLSCPAAAYSWPEACCTAAHNSAGGSSLKMPRQLFSKFSRFTLTGSTPMKEGTSFPRRPLAAARAMASPCS